MHSAAQAGHQTKKTESTSVNNYNYFGNFYFYINSITDEGMDYFRSM